MKTFKETIVWQHSLSLCKGIYKATEQFPSHQRYSLSNQMQRAAVSIMSNIAEGWYRPTRNDWQHFMRIAYGSSTELESQLILSNELGYLQKSDFDVLMKILDQIQRLLNYFTHKKDTNA